jgi:hypothetical protein
MRVAPVLRSSQASVCFIQCLSSRSGKSSRAWAPRDSVRLAAPIHGDDGLADQIVELERFNEIGIPDHRAIGDGDVRRFFPDRGHPLHALFEHRAGAIDGARILHRALHLIAQLGRGRAALGVAEFVEAREVLVALALRQFGLRGVGFSLSPQRRPTARPNTTRSISEFEPKRLAPCTETHAASPTAMRPGTTDPDRRRLW